MLAIQFIIGQLNGPVQQLISFIQSMQDAKISFDRINEIQALDDEEPAEMQLPHNAALLQQRYLY